MRRAEPGISIYSLMTGMREQIYSTVREIYAKVAQECNVPLLDLSRTFNYQNRSHYGSTEIEPSNFSSQCIADCIDYINKNYEGYKVYYAPNCDVNDVRTE